MVLRGFFGGVLAIYAFSWARLNNQLPLLDGVKMLYSDVLSSVGVVLRAWPW